MGILLKSTLFFCMVLLVLGGVFAVGELSPSQKLSSADNFLFQIVMFGVGLIVFILFLFILKAFYQRYFI